MNEEQAPSGLVLDFGNAAADLIEQALKSNFKDDLGHPLMNNQAFIALGNALQRANEYAAKKIAQNGN